VRVPNRWRKGGAQGAMTDRSGTAALVGYQRTTDEYD